MRVLSIAGIVFFVMQIQAQPQLPALDSLDAGWNSVVTSGMCSTGTPYQFYAKPGANSSDLLIFFNGGGGCWFGEACDLNSQPNIHTPFAEADQNNPQLARGIFDLAHPENPFADYAMVVLPYCTGDVHIGGGPREYTYTNATGNEVTITTYHNGIENSQTVLNWVYANFASPSAIVVSGSSAGAIGASYHSGPIAEHYRTVPVTLIADAAGAYGSPFLPVVHNAWNSAAHLPAWTEYAGETNDTISFEDFYIASARHNENLTIAQYNAAEDAVQRNFTLLMGDAPASFSLPLRLLNNYQKIESGVDEFYTYTAGGNTHTIMGSEIFYDYAVEGVRFVDWVSDLIAGNPVQDVSCVNEATGCVSPPVVSD